ncbi:MAG: TlpA family protein disulfide reductase [Nitrospirae bacterium]|nr:TlpA family protein disulfide reductase [Nitrospirota bacterium]
MVRLSHFILIASIVFVFFSCAKSEKGAVGNSDAAPSFVLADLKSNKVSLSDYKGRIVMLEFFASWCPPCQVSAPDIKSVYEKYRDRGFVVLAISIDKGTDAAAAAGFFMREFGLSYPALIDDGEVSRRYGVVSIPTSFIIDRQGKVRSKHIGLSPDFKNTLSKEIETLL